MNQVDLLISKTQANGWVCPMPQEWNLLWEMLSDRLRNDSGWKPSAPLILAAWWETDDRAKNDRFLQHLRWANERGVLQQVQEYLDGLKPQQWYLGENR